MLQESGSDIAATSCYGSGLAATFSTSANLTNPTSDYSLATRRKILQDSLTPTSYHPFNIKTVCRRQRNRYLFSSGAQHSSAERRADRRREAMNQYRGAEHIEMAMLRPMEQEFLLLRHYLGLVPIDFRVGIFTRACTAWLAGMSRPRAAQD